MPAKSLQVKTLQNCQKVLKKKILSEKYLDDLTSEFTQLLNVLKRTVNFNESDSVLVIGPRGCGKTALINEAMLELKNSCKNKDYLVINLNGLIHVDDNLALKDIVRQMNVESIDNDRFTGSFSDNLQHLLQSFRDCQGKLSKALIFILEEFHLFCSHRNQTLLYNLFDSSQSTQVLVFEKIKLPKQTMQRGICVVGITSRLDVTEMLEKRVKSRFSHRQLLLLHHPTIDQRISLFKSLLTLPLTKEYWDLKPEFVHCWNKNIEELSCNNAIIRTLKRQLELDSNEAKFRSFLMLVISRLSNENSLLKVDDFLWVHKTQSQDDKVLLLLGLSVLEICLVIAMNHQYEIFDGEPFNFEMIVGRYLKFANQNSAVQITQRPVILKAFERIKDLELLSPVGSAGKNVQKEFQLYHFLLTRDQVTSAVASYIGIPTDVSQWASSCLM